MVSLKKRTAAFLIFLVSTVCLIGCDVAETDTCEYKGNCESSTCIITDSSAESEEIASNNHQSSSEEENRYSEYGTEKATEIVVETVSVPLMTEGTTSETEEKYDVVKRYPDYNGESYIVINNNSPCFQEYEGEVVSYEYYGELDELGRCQAAYACIGTDIMPTEARGTIGAVKPTGWHTVKYDCIEDNYLYNRCHLIGYQLTGENANVRNLITGTRYMNVVGMLQFESKVFNYVSSTGNHVLYRVTPVFEGSNLLAKGVQMEAYSVEDKGFGIKFNVFVYNIQPGISINYANGESCLETCENETIRSNDDNIKESIQQTVASEKDQERYILNKNTKKFHYESCSSVSTIKAKNRRDYEGSRDELIQSGYSPCKRCNP